MSRVSTEMKVGLFALAIILVLVWATIRVADRTTITGGGYDVSFQVETASGLKTKAPVELAGVAVGVVRSIKLKDSTRARVVVRIDHGIKLSKDTEAILRTRGFLGETYVELISGEAKELLDDGDVLGDARTTGDLNGIISDFSEVSGNIRNLAGREDSRLNHIAENLEEFTRAIRDVTVRNTENIDRIAENVAVLSGELRELVQQNREYIETSMQNVASITGKIDRGEGTIGKLVNDEETIDSLNESLGGLNETLGGFHKLETEIGFHTEFLTNSEDFKNYIELALRPTPDKALLIALSTDPDPTPEHVLRSTDVTVGGTTTTVSTDTATVDRNELKFSMQLAKRFYDLTLRGGLIESTGGVGADYNYGPFSLHFSAFDFSTRFGERPHLKLLGNVNLTQNLFVVGGADDMLNPRQKTDYFVGAGFRFVDDDLKKFARFGGSSLFGK